MCVAIEEALIPQAFIFSFYVIVIRDFSMLLITCIYLRKVFTDNSGLRQIADGQRETHIQLYEFSTVVLSVLPLQHFR